MLHVLESKPPSPPPSTHHSCRVYLVPLFQFVCSYGWAYADVITKFSRMDWLPLVTIFWCAEKKKKKKTYILT